MPTESTFLLAGLLFLAAALGYFFARFGEEDDEEQASGSPEQLSADYIKGLNFLLNEQPDQALEVFMRMVEVDDETLETHFALGSLFRRRGEFERAIRVHQNIIARPNLSELHRDQAFISLADDYLSAGLFDRAEKLFQQLRESREHRSYALRKLNYIYEVTQDWEQAIDVCQKLEKLEPGAENLGRIAHYYCELAQIAVASKDYTEARKLLKKARASDGDAVRPELALADLSKLSSDHKVAIKGYRHVMEIRPALVSEVISRLAESCRAIEDQQLLSKSLQRLYKQDPEATKSIALACVHDPNIVNETALDCLRDYVLADNSLSQLVDLDSLENHDPDIQRAALDRIRAGLRSLDSQKLRYQCSSCGYSTAMLMWQCPSCRSWDSVTPVTGAIGR